MLVENVENPQESPSKISGKNRFTVKENYKMSNGSRSQQTIEPKSIVIILGILGLLLIIILFLCKSRLVEIPTTNGYLKN